MLTYFMAIGIKEWKTSMGGFGEQRRSQSKPGSNRDLEVSRSEER